MSNTIEYLHSHLFDWQLSGLRDCCQVHVQAIYTERRRKILIYAYIDRCTCDAFLAGLASHAQIYLCFHHTKSSGIIISECMLKANSVILKAFCRSAPRFTTYVHTSQPLMMHRESRVKGPPCHGWNTEAISAPSVSIAASIAARWFIVQQFQLPHSVVA
jgi:hypothetical protein